MINFLKSLISKPSFEIPEDIGFAIQHYIRFIDENPNPDLNDLMVAGINKNIEPQLLWQICAFFPAFLCRKMFSRERIGFPDEFKVFDAEMKCIQVGLLSKNTRYQSCVNSFHLITKVPTLKYITSSSAESQVIDSMVSKGSDPSDIMLGPLMLTEYTEHSA